MYYGLILNRKLTLIDSSIIKYKLPQDHVIIAPIVGECITMAQTPHKDNKTENPSEDGAEIDPEVIMKLLSQIPDGPLKNVEEIVFPEPLPHFRKSRRLENSKNRRGPKSIEDWNKEIRYAWGHLYDTERLEKSWLAQLPVAQKLAASEHGGRTIGSGLALQALLKKALEEVQKYDMEAQTKTVLTYFPKMKIKDVASQVDLDRSSLSRRYVSRAVNLLTVAFQRLTDKST